MVKKPSFGMYFYPFGPNLNPKNFFHRFYLYLMLDIVASYHYMQFQGKLKNETWQNSKKHNFGPNFGPYLGHQILFQKIWLHQSLDIMVSYHQVQYQKMLMIQSWENLVRDGQTDGQERFHRMLSTNVERPKTSVWRSCACIENVYKIPYFTLENRGNISQNQPLWILSIQLNPPTWTELYLLFIFFQILCSFIEKQRSYDDSTFKIWSAEYWVCTLYKFYFTISQQLSGVECSNFDW